MMKRLFSSQNPAGGDVGRRAARFLQTGLICFCLLAGIAQSAAGQGPGNREVCLSAKSVYAFARQIYEEGHYPAAAAEFRRFLHFFPHHERAADAAFFAAMCDFHLQRYPEAIRAFRKVIERNPDSEPAVEARFMLSRSYSRLGEHQNALQVLQWIARNVEDPRLRDRAAHCIGWLKLEAGDVAGARAAFESMTPRGRVRHGADRVLAELADSGKIKQKSPLAAGLLAVVPGGGYLYTGRYREAATAFFLITALAAASWESFDQDLHALGGIAGLAGLGFYGGSISGAVAGAHKYNRRAYDDLLERLERHRRPPLSLRFGRNSFLFAIECRF